MIKKLLFGALLLLSSSAYACCDLQFSEAIVRAPMPGVPNAAAFVSIENKSLNAKQLISASSEVAERVELHNHIQEDGMMKMRRVASIEIQGQQTVKLQPGGYHIMLFGLNKSLKEGESVSFLLTFSDEQTHQVQAVVQDLMSQHQHHHH
ncbi:copper chaperone PCu(A)C [Echinimonas agarilytica]|uniref:Copper chaperone PCu(A)C n=1 Tax=Echinimonas agarilytica TaxID=1215918 RepID=A0AA41W4E1_9GAMM|nr:copper chaperone PCu(A)C [Echinimonas agarilytica]